MSPWCGPSSAPAALKSTSAPVTLSGRCVVFASASGAAVPQGTTAWVHTKKTHPQEQRAPSFLDKACTTVSVSRKSLIPATYR